MNSVETIGRSSPLGATVTDNGVNFSVFSRSATSVELLFFDRVDDARPARVIDIDPSNPVALSLQELDHVVSDESPGTGDNRPSFHIVSFY